MKDIENRQDIEQMVNTFYASIKEDELLGPIFNGVIKDNWSSHLETMYRFWQTVLLHEYNYKGSPFPPHRKLPIDAQHFDRWLMLFGTAMDKNFKGKLADEAKIRAQKMAEMFQYKLNSNNH